MKKKPLKITWRSWCLYKLAKRDYSANELTQAILQRAKESEQVVDPAPIIDKLVAEGVIDDERYIQSQIRLHTDSYSIKGPRVLKDKLRQKGGITQDQIDQHLDVNDSRWADLAKESRSKFLLEKGINLENGNKVPIKLYSKLKQQLFRKGFTRSQIDAAMEGMVPDYHEESNFSSLEVERMVQKQIISGKGPYAIKQDLKQKGIEETIIHEFLDFEDEQWILTAKSTLEKKFRGEKPSSSAKKRKQIEFLLRKGFSMEQAKAAVEDK
ncbi:RecX family transcriptional regulator [bacterium]|nr:RecX family transcriptional regulator [bacterium]